MANKRKYTSARKFAEAVEKYLRSIRTRCVVYEVDSYGSYVRDDDGNKIPAKDADGNEMYVETYVVPPELHEIAHACGMVYDTWLKYASGDYGENFAEVCAAAKDVCLRWTLKEMHTRIKGVDAIEWILKVNYGISAEKSDTADREITVRIKSDSIGFEE